jgi:hypothetical protein
MRFTKIVFWIAAIWGVLVLTPSFFMLDRVGREYPPVITHPEFYYGFLCVALAWQFAFAVIATNPQRFRAIMVPAIFEKFSYVVVVAILFVHGHLSRPEFLLGSADLILGVLFLVAFFKTAS